VSGSRRLDRPLLVVLGVAFLVRALFAAWASRGAPTALVITDQFMYWFHGQNLAHGRGYIAYLTRTPSAYNPVGWPLMLAGVFAVTGALGLDRYDVTAAVLLQMTLGVLIVWLVHQLAAAALGRRIALVAAWLVALWPSQIAAVATFSIESAFTASYLAALLILVKHDWSAGAPTTRRVICFGLAIGLSAQIRPFSMPMLLASGVALLVAGHGWRAALKGTAVAAACALVVFIPWTIRNAVQMDAFVPSSTNLGDTMCMSRFPGSDGSFAFAVHEWCADSTLPEVERNSANMRAALRFVRDHPGEEVRLVGRRFARMMAHDHITLDEVVNNWGVTASSRTHLPVLAWTADVYYWTMMALAVPGIAVLVRDRRRSPTVAVLGCAAITLLVIPLGLWGAPRFHVPLLPLLAIAAATTVVQLAAIVAAPRSARPAVT
jgi:4-amino-4-deoxy-L-arabinose transferase-like glycosyltransferase